MSIRERVRRLANAGLRALNDGTGDPETALTNAIAELERAVEEARDALAGYAVVYRRAEQEANECAAEVERQCAQAESALRSGDEAGARRALSEQLRAQHRRESAQGSARAGQATYAGLQAQWRGVCEQLETARRRLTELHARGRAAEAEIAMDRQRRRAHEAGASDIDRLERRVIVAESAAEIGREVQHRPFSDAQLEESARERAVEDELTALRRRLAVPADENRDDRHDLRTSDEKA